MNFFGNLFNGRGEKNGLDCCTLIMLYLLLTQCGCNFNICDIFNSDLIKIFLLIYLLTTLCGNNDGCGCRG